MAEKPKPKPKKKGTNDQTVIIIIIVVVVLISILASSGYFKYSFQKLGDFFRNSKVLTTIGDVLVTMFFIWSTFFILLICYCVVRLFEIRKKEHEHLQHEIAEYAHHQAEKEKHLKAKQSTSKNERWDNVLNHLDSSDPAGWKLAIIEADIMLDNLLNQLGFRGENLGEKLKTVDRDKFPGLNNAWEVHLVRNRIAHEGPNFELPEREAKRIIALYEAIFKGFNYI